MKIRKRSKAFGSRNGAEVENDNGDNPEDSVIDDAERGEASDDIDHVGDTADDKKSQDAAGGDEFRKEKGMQRIAAFIVDKRKGFYLAFIGLIIFSIFSMNWVSVNEELTDYLPEDTETRQGLTLMEEEFTTYATASVMVDNISYAQAEDLCGALEKTEGVHSVDFDDSEEHYKSASALFSVTFDADTEAEESKAALDDIREKLDSYDTYISTDVGNQKNDIIQSEMKKVMLIVVLIIIMVLLFTSHTYAEIPIMMATFGVAALLNMGSNFMLGEISFISNTVAVVLQLALAIDYAIILCHRYTEEREHLERREAVVTALSKAIPEISSSSLTTLSGLAAMTFMQFRIGADMGIVLIKAIIISLLCVFTLMPGLLMSCSRLIDRSHHKNFVPEINVWGKIVLKLRYITPAVFVVILVGAYAFSSMCPYVFSDTTLKTFAKNETQIATDEIKDTFGNTNIMAMIVPSGDYEKEAEIIAELEAMPEVDSVTALGSIEAMDGYVLTDELNIRQFSELTDTDADVCRLLYSAYAADREEYGRIIGGIDSYRVPLIDIFIFLHDKIEEGYVTLDDDVQKEIDDNYTDIMFAKSQLESDSYSRLVMKLNIPEESDETFRFIDKLHSDFDNVYDEKIVLTGNSTSDYDLSNSFSNDNKLVSTLSAVFVIIILLFTFQSAGIPVLLIIVIQGSIWMNFSFPYLESENLFFMSYLVVSSIQMGANIDYAIVITNRYTEIKQTLPLKEAIVKTLNQAFPTILTSGSILAAAGLLIGFMSSDTTISSIGICLGRGTIISIALVMLILPQILLLGDKIIEKTSFKLKKPAILREASGKKYVFEIEFTDVETEPADRQMEYAEAEVIDMEVSDSETEKKADNVKPEKEVLDDEKQ